MLGFRAGGRCQVSAERRISPEAFKREAVWVASSGMSLEKVATELGLHDTVLRLGAGGG